jgi:hypothetical protein
MSKSKRNVEYVKLIKETPIKKYEGVFAGLTYILVTLLFVFAIVPTISTINTINKEIKDKERIKGALDDKMEALSLLDIQYKENEATLKDLTLLYPAGYNFSLFLSNIDAVISRNNFLLDGIAFSEFDSGADTLGTTVLKPWAVRLSVSGQKVSLMTLLRDLEAMPMYPVIERVFYTSVIDDFGNTKFTILLRLYHVQNPNFYD